MTLLLIKTHIFLFRLLSLLDWFNNIFMPCNLICKIVVHTFVQNGTYRLFTVYHTSYGCHANNYKIRWYAEPLLIRVLATPVYIHSVWWFPWYPPNNLYLGFVHLSEVCLVLGILHAGYGRHIHMRELHLYYRISKLSMHIRRREGRHQ